MRKNRSILLLILAMMFALLTGCTQTTATLAPEERQIIFAIWSAPEGVFNHNLYQSRYDYNSMGPIFDGLLRSKPDLSLQANLAEAWEIRDGGLVFYYKLRDDIYWHDGKPVTTADVKFTFEWMIHPDYTGVRASLWEKLEGVAAFRTGEADHVSGIKVLNEREIEFHFSEIDAPAYRNVSTWPISPEHVFAGTPIKDLEKHEAIRRPIGSGPFKFENFVEGQYLSMVSNERYHLGVPRIDRIIVKVVSADVALAHLLTGSVDAALMSPNKRDWDKIKTSGFLSIIEYPMNGYQYMGMNNQHELFGDVRVRQALTYAIDRQGLVDSLLDGMGIVQVGHMAKASWAYNDLLKPYPFDPARTRRLLADAGFTPGADGILQRDGERFSFTLSYPTGDPVRMDSALVIQQNLKDVGIEVRLDIMEVASLAEKVFEHRDFDAYLLGWELDADPDATSLWASGETWNAVQFLHQKSDELLAAGRSVLETEARKKIYHEWQLLLYNEAPYVFLYAPNEAYVFNSALKGFSPNPFGFWWNVEKWYWDR